MKGYTSISKVEDYTGDTIAGTDEESIVENYITAAEQYIDQQTNRNFIASEETRYYSGMGKSKLFIDDATSIVTVNKASDRYGSELTTLDSDDYVIIPKDHTERDEPIHVLHLKNDYWTRGQQNHEITATFGYSDSAPEDIELATTILAAILRQDSESSELTGKQSERIGDYQVDYNEDSDLGSKFEKVDAILMTYKDYIF